MLDYAVCYVGENGFGCIRRRDTYLWVCNTQHLLSLGLRAIIGLKMVRPVVVRVGVWFLHIQLKLSRRDDVVSGWRGNRHLMLLMVEDGLLWELSVSLQCR